MVLVGEGTGRCVVGQGMKERCLDSFRLRGSQPHDAPCVQRPRSAREGKGTNDGGGCHNSSYYGVSCTDTGHNTCGHHETEEPHPFILFAHNMWSWIGITIHFHISHVMPPERKPTLPLGNVRLYDRIDGNLGTTHPRSSSCE